MGARSSVARLTRALRLGKRRSDSIEAAPERQAPTPAPGFRVLVLTAPVGEGHAAAARALAAGVRHRNEAADVSICDALAELPPLLRWLLGDAYRWQLHAAPWLFGMVFGALRRSRLLRRLARAGLALAGSKSLLRIVRRDSADVIVSTWPPATTILGCLRLRGKVRVPVCATITDFAGLELWADKGVDLHLVMHESLVAKVERIAGSGSARHVAPLVGREFHVPCSSTEARRALGLPADGVVVAVSGGGWAVGDLAGAVETALRFPNSTVLCLCGREDTVRERLRREFAAAPRVRVLGFTRDMSDVLAAADVLVHSTGGVTSLEALVRGCPIVAYGAPPGHAPLLAREMASLGLVSHARSAAELRAALVAALRAPRVSLTAGVDAASIVLTLRPRIVAPLRARLARATATAVAAAVACFALMASDLTYPVVAEAFALPETTAFSTDRPDVALVIRGESGDLLALAPLARRLHVRASVAVSGSPSKADVSTLRGSGLDPIPELRTQGIRSWFDASRELRDQCVRYGLHRSFNYLAHHEGFTLPDYLLGRKLGGEPVQGQDLSPTGTSTEPLHRGEIVVLTLDPTRVAPASALRRAISAIANEGFAASSVRLLAARSDRS